MRFKKQKQKKPNIQSITKFLRMSLFGWFQGVCVCWAVPHRPTSPALAQLRDRRKSPESAIDTSMV